MKIATTLTIALLGLLVGTPRPAAAEPICRADEVRKQAHRTLFELQRRLDSYAPAREELFVELTAYVQEWKALGDSARIRVCAESPRFRRWWRGMERRAAGLVTRAERRLDEVCAPLVSSQLRRQRDLLEAALDRGALGRARELAYEFGIELRSRALYRNCRATRDEVDAMLAETLPSVLHQVKLPTVLAEIARSYYPSQATLARARRALAGKPGEVDAVVGEIVDRRRALAGELADCREHAGQARELGASDATPVPRPDGDGATPLAEVERWCASDDLARVTERARDLWAAHEKHLRERWEYLNIHAFPMRAVYRRLGKPTRVVDGGGKRIRWHYDAKPCQVVTFTKRGRLISEVPATCPSQGVASR